MMATTSKHNRHFGRDTLYIGGLYELRDYGAKDDHRHVKHDPVRLRDVRVQDDGRILFGVSFRARSKDEPQDDQGYSTEVGCECVHTSLRSAL
jgi:hypothetical protein